MQDAETSLDLRGLKCPLPTLRTRRALAGLAPGAILVVAATDPMAAIDIPHLVRERGDRLDASSCDGETMIFRIRKRAVEGA